MTRVCLIAGAVLALVVACAQQGTSAEDAGKIATLAITRPLDETGNALGQEALSQVTQAIAEGLRGAGFVISAEANAQASLLLQLRVIECPGDRRGCLGSVTVTRQPSGLVVFSGVARTPPPGDLTQFGQAVARTALRGLQLAVPVGVPGQDISTTGTSVHHLGDGRFAITDGIIDLHAIAHAHDPHLDPDVPLATDVTLDDGVPPRTDDAGRSCATITLYQIDSPLTGLPSHEAGIGRGTDFRDPANLVKAAYSNYVSPVLTEDRVPVRVASHPIGHFAVKVEIPGYPTLLTGMTTISRADTELVDLTIGRQLGIGGVLLTPEPGRLNSSAEVARELALRQRRLRVVDGLHFRLVSGRNVGPEYLFDDGRVVFARVRLPVVNATDAMAYFIEYIHRGEHNRFGSLLNSPFKGTGAGCAAFAMGWLQAAGVVPFITMPEPRATEDSEQADLWRATRARLHLPWRLTGCDDRLGAARVTSAQLTIYDLLFHGETAGSIRAASEGLAAHVRDSYGSVTATLFQIGALTPLRDLVINGQRKDPYDRADYTWSGPGIDVSYWDNARFAAWIRRLWANGSRDPHVSLVREGHFYGIEIDAMAAPRQRAPLFAEADRLNAVRAAGGAAPVTCQEVFDRGLE